MEIEAFIKSKHVDHIRVETLDKKQEIDIFYTESKKFDVEELLVNGRIKVATTIQSVDYYGLKLAKHWLSRIIFPIIKFEYKKKQKGSGDRDWAKVHTDNN